MAYALLTQLNGIPFGICAILLELIWGFTLQLSLNNFCLVSSIKLIELDGFMDIRYKSVTKSSTFNIIIQELNPSLVRFISLI